MPATTLCLNTRKIGQLWHMPMNSDLCRSFATCSRIRGRHALVRCESSSPVTPSHIAEIPLSASSFEITAPDSPPNKGNVYRAFPRDENQRNGLGNDHRQTHHRAT